MKKLLIGAIGSLALIANSASAADKQYYFGIEAGYAFVDAQGQESADYLASLVGQTVSYTEDDGAAFGRIYLGYDFEKNMAFELGVFATDDIDATFTTAGGNGSGSATFSASASGIDAAVLFKAESSGVYGKIGGHYSKLRQDAAASFAGYGVAASGYAWQEDWGVGLLAGFGYEMPLSSDNLKARLAYTYYDSLGGESDADAHVLTVGLTF